MFFNRAWLTLGQSFFDDIWDFLVCPYRRKICLSDYDCVADFPKISFLSNDKVHCRQQSIPAINGRLQTWKSPSFLSSQKKSSNVPWGAILMMGFHWEARDFLSGSRSSVSYWSKVSYWWCRGLFVIYNLFLALTWPPVSLQDRPWRFASAQDNACPYLLWEILR